jgi:hypothetical protein
MATLQFPIGISQCILSMGIAHLEPQWDFSVKSGKVTLNLTWEHVNTGTLAPGPPPGMKPVQHPLPQYNPVPNMYYKNTARARYVAPRFSHNNSISRSDQDPQWRTTSQVLYTDTSVENVHAVPKYGHRLNNHFTSGCNDITSDEHNNTNNCNELITNNITSQKIDDDDMKQESLLCEVTSNPSHISLSISDKSNTDEKMGDIDSDNCSDSDSDRENSQIDSFMNTLYENDHESEDNVSESNSTGETPDISISSAMTTVMVCEVISNSTPSCTLPVNEMTCSALSQTDAHISAILSSNISVSGDDFHQQSSSEVDMAETCTNNNETQDSDEPRFLSDNETCETLNSWVEDLTQFLRAEDNFSRLIDSGWKTSSVPNRGCKDDNDAYALDALIGYVVRFSNGALLRSQTRSSKSLKALLNGVYRHYNIPSKEYIKSNDSS